MITVVCYLWHGHHYSLQSRWNFGQDHVVRLRNMLRRHLPLEHDMVCVTHDAAWNEDVEGVRTVPVEENLIALAGVGWPKLSFFRPDAAEFFGGNRLLLIDLDCVVVDSLAPLVDREDKFVIWSHGGVEYCTAMILSDAGYHSEAWQKFDASIPTKITPPLEQLWIRRMYPSIEKVGAIWTKKDGVLKFSRDAKDGLPRGARIVFFNGKSDPSSAELQQQHHWIAENWA